MLDSDKTILVERLHFQAYAHPKFAKLRFPNHVFCPTCHSELALVLHDDGARRLLCCMNCGVHYLERDNVA